MPTTRMQVLGWIEHCEREHPGAGTTIPIWLCSMEAFREVLAGGYVYEIGRQSVVPRLGMSHLIYGLTDKGRAEFFGQLPKAG